MARKFARLGASLVLWDLPRSEEALENLKAEIEVGINASASSDGTKQSVVTGLVDVTNREVVESTVRVLVRTKMPSLAPRFIDTP